MLNQMKTNVTVDTTESYSVGRSWTKGVVLSIDVHSRVIAEILSVRAQDNLLSVQNEYPCCSVLSKAAERVIIMLCGYFSL